MLTHVEARCWTCWSCAVSCGWWSNMWVAGTCVDVLEADGAKEADDLSFTNICSKEFSITA
jgi:hypothetical protein